ncbi:MAG: hypothetical protein HOE90_24605 [Bacteriovoracaceae bacterium]|jgi:hypothetical protein|nr:hypothetical protein [Bacteriovoracaceae bacterium]
MALRKNLNKKVKQSRFADPKYILEALKNFMNDGEFHSMTDLISAYIKHSPKYLTQEEFAAAIGTNRQTLHRMMAHENVSLNLFFSALEQIHDDAQ